MKPLLTVLITIFACTYSATPHLGAGWFWDIGGGLGFAAFGGLLLLIVASGRPLSSSAHQYLAYSVLAITLAHVFCLLLGDPVTVEYILPGAPAYMWSGIASLVLLFVLMIIASPSCRSRIHRHHTGFRRWHKGLAYAAVAATAYHIVGSGFYVGQWYQAAMLLVLAVVVCGSLRIRTNLANRAAARPAFQFLAAALALTGLFALSRNTLT